MFTEMPSFIYGAGTGETPASVARKRAIAEALASGASGRAPRDVGEGLTAIGQALAFRAMDKRAGDAEKAGQASSQASWDPIVAALAGNADAGATDPVAPDPAALPEPDYSATAPDAAPADPTLPKIGGPDEPMPDAAAAPTDAATVQTADAGSLDNVSLGELIKVANDPWASDTQKQIVGELLKQKLKTPDPNDALQTEKLRLEIEKMKNPDTANEYGKRRAAAEQNGLKPDDPAYQSFILTGRMPREDQAPLTAVDKKAILDSEDMAMAGKNTVDMLTSVLAETDGPGTSLNDRASYGATANTQAWLARNDPTGIMDDKTGEATTELQNVVLNQALGSLKAIFGAAPTEGERKILVDLQASVDKTPAERKIIINRAIEMAQRRQQFYTDRATEIRGETYYKPGGGAAGQNGVEPPPAVAPIGAAPEAGTPAQPQSDADFQALPSGALYIDPDDGKQYRKP